MNLIKKVFTGEIKGVDERDSTLTAYVSTNAIDRMREVLDPQGADLSHYKKNPIVLWAHNYDLPPIGKALWIKKDGNGILAKVKFASTEFAKEIFELYKEGFMNAFSVGFIPKDKEWGKEEDRENPKKPRVTYKTWELLEFSAVPVPANPEALSLAMKKGIQINDQIKEAFETYKEDISDEEETVEEAVEEKAEGKVEDGLDELLAENKNLSEQVNKFKLEVDSLIKENADLRMRLYSALDKLNNKANSEIAGKEVGEIFSESLARAIRKAQGKVE